MNLICRLKGHDWGYCRCKRCGETRDEHHKFEREERDRRTGWKRFSVCTCEICGKVQDRDHRWSSCRCIDCGKQRDEGHLYQNGICRVCGKVMPFDPKEKTEEELAQIVFDVHYSPEARRQALDSVDTGMAMKYYKAFGLVGDEITQVFLKRLPQTVLKELADEGFLEALNYSDDLDHAVSVVLKGTVIEGHEYAAIVQTHLEKVTSEEQCRRIGEKLLAMEEPYIREGACLALGGHIPNSACLCERCGAPAHDWTDWEWVDVGGYPAVSERRRLCRRCGTRESW